MNTRRLVVTLAFLGCLFYAGDRAPSQNWAATSSPSEGWNSIASSADGTQVVAAEGSPGPDLRLERCRSQLDGDHCASRLLELRRVIGRWRQTDGGVVLPFLLPRAPLHLDRLRRPLDFKQPTRWIRSGRQRPPRRRTMKLAMVSFNSDSGTFTVISTSTNSGSTWTVPSQPYNLSSSWNWVASSADGTKLVAAEGYLGFWAHLPFHRQRPDLECDQRADDQRDVATACSADGSHLLAASNDGQVYTSTNSGTTWLAQQCAVEQLGDRVAAYNHRRRLVGGWHSVLCCDVHGPDVHFDQRRSGVD